MRYDVEHKDRTRGRVLAEAARAIRLDGPERVGVAGIMAKAGLTHGGFYAHFKSKDDLVVAAIGQMFDEGGANFERITEGLEPEAALARYIGFYLSPGHRDARDSGCPLPALLADIPRLPEPARAGFGRGVERLTARLAGLLAAVGRADADALARSTLAEMVGTLSLARARGDGADSDAMLRQARRALRERLGLAAPAPVRPPEP